MSNQYDSPTDLRFLSDPALEQELSENGKLVAMNKGDVIIREGQFRTRYYACGRIEDIETIRKRKKDQAVPGIYTTLKSF